MKITVADEVWIGTALLHWEHPDRQDFEKQEIVERIRQEGLFRPERPGLSTHISSHVVANKAPQPGKYRMLVETGRGRRRLFREGDHAYEGRTGKIVPNAHEIPAKYHPLLSWYQSWSKGGSKKKSSLEKLAGKFKGMWGEDPVRYVRRLRGYE